MNRVELLADKYEQLLVPTVEAKQELLAACRDHLAIGYSEVDVAKWAGVSRATLRKWVGKDA
jgi:transposase